MMRFKETAEDIAVKLRLWEASYRELMHFAERYAEEHVVGERSSEGQESVVWAAKAKGYPIGVVRRLGSLVRRDMREAPEAKAVTERYRERLGLWTKAFEPKGDGA